MSLLNLVTRILTLLALLAIGASARAQGVSALVCSPTTVTGGSGAVVTCSVTLSAAAPAGGASVTLSSSLPELAASVPSVLVPAGQTGATFAVATNAKYRRYSGLAFSATITASSNAVARTATLSFTAQARPADIVRNPDTDRRGPSCAGEPGVLFTCQSGPNSTCSFRQECTLGCLRRPAQATRWQDACATSGPAPITLSPRVLIGGNPGSGTLLLSAPAPAGSFGQVGSSSLAAAPQNRLNMPIATGATSLSFNLLSARVNAIEFANMDAAVVTPQSTSSGTFFAARSQRTWLAVVPGAAPNPNLVSLNLDATSLRGGLFTAGNACIDQLKPAPAVGDVPLSVTSSNPALATVGTLSFPQGANCATFGVQTSAVAATTVATITAMLGAQLRNVDLTLTAAPGATRVTSYFLDPLQVTGGSSSTGTVVLNGLAPAGGALVTLASANAAVAAPPTNVLVPAGSDRANFVIATSAVAASTSVTLTATYLSGPAFTSLLVLP